MCTDQIKWALCAVSPWKSPRRFSLRFGPFFASSPPRFRETPRLCLIRCKPLRPNPNPSSVFSPPRNASKILAPRPMGRRKERRLAAMAAAGRRVKLDLFLDPSPGKLRAPPRSVFFDLVAFGRGAVSQLASTWFEC